MSKSLIDSHTMTKERALLKPSRGPFIGAKDFKLLLCFKGNTVNSSQNRKDNWQNVVTFPMCDINYCVT